MELLPIVVVLSSLTTIGFLSYLYLSTRHKERMALLESGADAKIFRQNANLLPNLKWGMFLVAIGLAIFVGNFLEEWSIVDDETGYFGTIFLFGGIALLIYYNIIKDRTLEEL